MVMIGIWIPKFAVVIAFKLCSLGLEIIKNVARFLLEHIVLTLLASVIYPPVWRNVWIWLIFSSVFGKSKCYAYELQHLIWFSVTKTQSVPHLRDMTRSLRGSFVAF